MSGIVLSASVRQNLLSLQSTAALLATTQNDLATGNKVNSALDNPTEFFTAQGLNNRASDIGNLLDGISNGVQVLQAANTGITSLQGYISTAQSIANQVLQAPTGYSTKSNITTTAITGATADNLLGTYAAGVNAAATGTTALAGIDLTGTPAANAVVTGTTAAPTIDLSGTPATNAVDTGSSALGTIDLTNPTTTAATLSTATPYTAVDLSTNDLTIGLKIDGQTVSVDLDNTITAADHTAVTGDELATAINAQINTSLGTTNANYVSFDSGTNEFSLTSQTQGTTGSVEVTSVGGTATNTSGFAVAAQTTGTSTPAAAITFDVNSQHVTLAAGSSYTAAQVADQINQQAGTLGKVAATVDTNGKLVLTSTSTTLGTGDSVTVDNFSAGSDASTLGFTAGSSSTAAGHALVAGQALTFDVNSQHVTLAAGSSYTAAQVAAQINQQAGTAGKVNATVDTSGKLVITSTDAASATDEVTVDNFSGGEDGTALGLAAAPDAHGTDAAPAANLTFNVNGKTVTLNGGTDYTAADIAAKINTDVGTSAGVHASLDSTGHLVVKSTGTANAQDTVTIDTFSTGTDASELGFAAGASTTASGADPATSPISGLELTIAATGNGTATDITFGTGDGQISTLNQLNTALSANNLQASIDSTSGAITITTTNNAASSTIGIVGGTAAGTGDIFAAYNGVTGPAAVADPNSQATRASLVAQYNQTMQQINTTAQDSSFNGINLLNGDTLNLTFDETGASKLSITGVTFNTAGLGLSSLTSGSAFLDSNSANAVLSQLTQASTTLRTEASSLGSNLSVVQNRQDFNKSLINVLQTGASNLTLADPNEEAANSQALSTRQSIAVSALALANQSQQSVLQLLR